MSAILAIILALICLAGGGLIGFFIARGGASDAKRAEAVREEFDTYRRDVTAHFGETAEHFRTLGRQYRELYEHMASGADALCDNEARERLDFPSLRAIEAVAEAADDAEAAADPRAGDLSGTRSETDTRAQASEPEADTDDTGGEDTAGDVPGDEARRPAGDADADAANDDDVTGDDTTGDDATGHDATKADDGHERGKTASHDADKDDPDAADAGAADDESGDPDTLRRAGAT